MSKDRIDWNKVLDDIAADSQDRQLEREALEQSILKAINSLPMPEAFANVHRIGTTPEEVSTGIEKVVEGFTDHEDVAPLIDGILYRTNSKRMEIFTWCHEQGIDSGENMRRAQVAKRFGYRRQVLKEIYQLKTEETWLPTNQTTAEDILLKARQAEKDAKRVDFDGDYTDLLF